PAGESPDTPEPGSSPPVPARPPTRRTPCSPPLPGLTWPPLGSPSGLSPRSAKNEGGPAGSLCPTQSTSGKPKPSRADAPANLPDHARNWENLRQRSRKTAGVYNPAAYSRSILPRRSPPSGPATILSEKSQSRRLLQVDSP